MKIQIIGVGSVGSSIAFGILLFKSRGYLSQYDKMKLHDIDFKRARAELLDLRRAREILSVRDFVIDKSKWIADADVTIICAGKKRSLFDSKTLSDSFLYAKNWENIANIMKKLIIQDRRIIMVTNPAKMFANKYDIEHAGDKCDKICSPDKIIEGKGYTNWGITAEVLNML